LRYRAGLFTAAVFCLFALRCGAEEAASSPLDAEPMPDAHALLASVIDQTRGTTSYAELSMVIHRPDWERSSSLQAWTRGREDTLIRFTEPARDAGNATLKDDEKMWTFSPKLNRVIRLPFSMMSQGWAGSDFSYNDLSRTDSMLRDYELEITDRRGEGDHVIYTLEAVPHDSAPVVWGKEVIVFRDDYVLLEHTFYDQDFVPLKRIVGTEVADLGGRTFATRMRMSRLDEPDHWTEVHYYLAEFDIEIDEGLFTVFALKTGRAR
jgi:outer membrane lipoprotein-sorting protein